MNKDGISYLDVMMRLHEENTRLKTAIRLNKRQRYDLLVVLEACLLRDDIANDELGDLIRAAIAKAKGE